MTDIGSPLFCELQRDCAPTAMDELYAEIAGLLCLPVEAVDFDVAWDYAQGAAEEGAKEAWPRWPQDYLHRLSPAVGGSPLGSIGAYTIYGGGK